jgi:hypothetical protein
MDVWRALHIEVGFWLFFPLLFLGLLGYTLTRVWWLNRRARKAAPPEDARP